MCFVSPDEARTLNHVISLRQPQRSRSLIGATDIKPSDLKDFCSYLADAAASTAAFPFKIIYARFVTDV